MRFFARMDRRPGFPRRQVLFLCGAWIGFVAGGWADAEAPPAGVPGEARAWMEMNPDTGRLEWRDRAGALCGEILPGTIDRPVGPASQLFPISFGRDPSERPTALFRTANQQSWLRLVIQGHEFLISPLASLLVAWDSDCQIVYFASLSGEVWRIRAGVGDSWQRLKPSSP